MSVPSADTCTRTPSGRTGTPFLTRETRCWTMKALFTLKDKLWPLNWPWPANLHIFSCHHTGQLSGAALRHIHVCGGFSDPEVPWRNRKTLQTYCRDWKLTCNYNILAKWCSPSTISTIFIRQVTNRFFPKSCSPNMLCYPNTHKMRTLNTPKTLSWICRSSNFWASVTVQV